MTSLSPDQVLFSKVYFLYLLLKSVPDIQVSDTQYRPISNHRTIVEIIDTKLLRKEYPVSFKNKFFKQIKLKIYEKDIKKIESIYEEVDTIKLIDLLKNVFYDFNILDYFVFLNNLGSDKMTENDALKGIYLRFNNYLHSVKINFSACSIIKTEKSSFVKNVHTLLKDSRNLINLIIQKDNHFCQQVVQYVLCLFPLEFLYCKLNNEITKLEIVKNNQSNHLKNEKNIQLKNKENECLGNVYVEGLSKATDHSNLYNKDFSYNKKVNDDDDVTTTYYDQTNQSSINYQFDTTANSVSTSKSFIGNNISDTILVNDDFYKLKATSYNLFNDIVNTFEFEQKLEFIKNVIKTLGEFKHFENLFVDAIFKQNLDMFFNSLFKLFHSIYEDFLKRLLVQKTVKHLALIHKSYTQFKIFLIKASFNFDERWDYLFETLNIKQFEDFFEQKFKSYFENQKFAIVNLITDIETIQNALESLDPRYDFIKINFIRIFKAKFTRNYKNMIKKFKTRAKVKEFEVFKIFQNFVFTNITRFNLKSTFDENKNFNNYFVKFYKNFVLFLSDKFYKAIKEIFSNKEIDEEFRSIKILDVLKLGRVLGKELQDLFFTTNGIVYTNVMVHFTRNISRDLLELLSDIRNDFVKNMININAGINSEQNYQKLFRLLNDTCSIIIFINDYRKIFESSNQKGSELTNNKIQYYELESNLNLEDIKNYKIEIKEKILYSNETLFMQTYESEEDLEVKLFYKEKQLYKIPITDVSNEGRVQIELKKRKIMLNLKFRMVVVEDFSIGFYVDMILKNGSLLCKYINKEIVKLEFDNLGNEALLQKLKNTGVLSTIKGLESDYFYNVLWRHYCEKIYTSNQDNDKKIKSINDLYELLDSSIENKNVLDKENIYYDYILNDVVLIKPTKKTEVIIYYEKDNLMLQGEIKVKTEVIEDTMRKLKKKIT